jgi:hypothetical protein
VKLTREVISLIRISVHSNLPAGLLRVTLFVFRRPATHRCLTFAAMISWPFGLPLGGPIGPYVIITALIDDSMSSRCFVLHSFVRSSVRSFVRSLSGENPEEMYCRLPSIKLLPRIKCVGLVRQMRMYQLYRMLLRRLLSRETNVLIALNLIPSK